MKKWEYDVASMTICVCGHPWCDHVAAADVHACTYCDCLNFVLLKANTPTPMKYTIYLAARYSRFPEMQQYAKDLVVRGHVVTSRWILGDHDIRAHGQSSAPHYMPQWAQEDWEDLVIADTVISFTEAPDGAKHGRGRGGRHVEFGIALAMQKRCIVIHHRENVFHWLPAVEFYSTWEEFLIMVE